MVGISSGHRVTPLARVRAGVKVPAFPRLAQSDDTPSDACITKQIVFGLKQNEKLIILGLQFGGLPREARKPPAQIQIILI